jgi:predicted negative regulator of RcsB-dependent stress response
VPSGPPDDFKPANELYGELLLQAGRKKEALEQFRASLLRTPNRALSLAGAAHSFSQ